MDLKKSKILHFPKGLVHGFCQKLKILFLFSFSVKQLKTRCFVTFSIENLPTQTRKTMILKSRKLAFFLRGQAMVFGQKQETMFLFTFLAILSKTKCFVSLQIEIQPFKTKNASIQKKKMENWHFSKGVSPWFLVKNWNFCSCVVFQKNSPKQVFL